MKQEEFEEILTRQAQEFDIGLNNKQKNQFFTYMEELIEWNEKVNLTAITEKKDIITKHFVDSISSIKYLPTNCKIIDVGTGAGFPGIPLNIINDNYNITLLDSLEKRINFLNNIIQKLELKNIETIHSRAEDLGNNSNNREQYDIAISRAVAPLNILLEYMLPFVKIGGKCICMKGSNVEEEIKACKTALSILGGEIQNIDTFKLPESEMNRNIIIINKIKNTDKKYPRKAGTPSKKPL